MGSRLLRREHVVAASLVGAVVVVVGYASGFGVRPVIGSQAPGGGGGATQTRPPALTQPPPATSTTVPPTQPAGNGNRQVVPRSPLPPAPPAATRPPQPHPPAPPPTSPPPPTQPPPPCVPGLVPVALDTLLATIGRATDALGLPLGGLLAPTPLPLPPIDTAAAAPTAAQGPLDPLIGTCPPAAPPTQPPR